MTTAAPTNLEEDMTDEELLLDYLTWCDSDQVLARSVKNFGRINKRRNMANWPSEQVQRLVFQADVDILRPFKSKDGVMFYPKPKAQSPES